MAEQSQDSAGVDMEPVEQDQLVEEAVQSPEPADTQQSCQETAGAGTCTQIGAEYNCHTAYEHIEAHQTDHEVMQQSYHKDLTFSGPPHVPKAKPYHRVDYSHSKVKLMKIAHDNQLLVQRLTSISHKDPGWAKDLANLAPSNVASSAVNRRRAATAIAQENHALYQRLVAIKPSRDISRDTLEAQHRRNEGYRTNCATFKPAAAGRGID